MHMADALISPSVGATFCAIKGGTLIYSARKLREEANEKVIPLMGDLGAFGTLLSVLVATQLGAFSVVIQTLFSGISDLPFKTFVLLMRPIHLAIGLVEGVVTVAFIRFNRCSGCRIHDDPFSGIPYRLLVQKTEK